MAHLHGHYLTQTCHWTVSIVLALAIGEYIELDEKTAIAGDLRSWLQ